MYFMLQSNDILFFLAFIMIVFPNSAFFKQIHLGVISENNLEKSSYYVVKIIIKIGRAWQCIVDKQK